MKRLARFVSVVWRLAPYGLAFLRDRRAFLFFGRPRVRSAEHHQRRADRLAAMIGGLGPAFVKVAQLLSARADLLPEPYLSAIGTLQDRVSPVPTDEIRRVIESELGRPVSDVFDSFVEVEKLKEIRPLHHPPFFTDQSRIDAVVDFFNSPQ